MAASILPFYPKCFTICFSLTLSHHWWQQATIQGTGLTNGSMSCPRHVDKRSWGLNHQPFIGQPALHQWFLACRVSQIPSNGDEQAGKFAVAREGLPNCIRRKQFNGCTLSDDLHFLTCTVQISRMKGCEQDQWQKWFFQKLLTISKTPATHPALSTKAVHKSS